MPEQDETSLRILLGGNWTIAGITDRLNELTAHLETLLTCRENAVAPLNSVICVGGVEAIDACGCQLLAIFLRHLRQHGFVPTIVNHPEHFRSSVAMLGFGDELEGTGG